MSRQYAHVPRAHHDDIRLIQLVLDPAGIEVSDIEVFAIWALFSRAAAGVSWLGIDPLPTDFILAIFSEYLSPDRLSEG